MSGITVLLVTRRFFFRRRGNKRSWSDFPSLTETMQPASFLCPHCAVSLRVNDRRFVGRTIDCPDCGTTLLIVGEPQGTIQAEVFVASEVSESTEARHVSETTDAAAAVLLRTLRTFVLGSVRNKEVGENADLRRIEFGPTKEQSSGIVPTPDARANKADGGFPSALAPILSAWRQGLRNPVVVAWTLAGLASLLLLVTFFSLNAPPAKNDSLQARQPTENSSKPLPPLPSPHRDNPRLVELPGGTAQDPVPTAQTERFVADGSHVDRTALDTTAPVPKAQSPDEKALAVPNRKTSATPSMPRDIPHERAPVPERSAPAESKVHAIANQPPPAPQPRPDANAEIGPKRVRMALAQPIAGFEQAKPVPFRELLIQVEEMAAVSIQFNEQEIGPETLDQPVSLKLHTTTVRAILEELCGQVGLTWEIHGSVIRLHKRSSEASIKRATK